jgi:hypothetical protein
MANRFISAHSLTIFKEFKNNKRAFKIFSDISPKGLLSLLDLSDYNLILGPL